MNHPSHRIHVWYVYLPKKGIPWIGKSSALVPWIRHWELTSAIVESPCSLGSTAPSLKVTPPQVGSNKLPLYLGESRSSPSHLREPWMNPYGKTRGRKKHPPKIKAKIHEETVDNNMKTSIKTEKHPLKPVEKHPESTHF